jgi:hypothetical protein
MKGTAIAPNSAIQRGETCIVYLSTLDYSRNKEAKLIPFVKRQHIVEDPKESAIGWRA